MFGYHCYHCGTNTKDEYVNKCNYCDYEVCSSCPYKHKKCKSKNLVN